MRRPLSVYAYTSLLMIVVILSGPHVWCLLVFLALAFPCFLSLTLHVINVLPNSTASSPTHLCNIPLLSGCVYVFLHVPALLFLLACFAQLPAFSSPPFLYTPIYSTLHNIQSLLSVLSSSSFSFCLIDLCPSYSFGHSISCYSYTGCLTACIHMLHLCCGAIYYFMIVFFERYFLSSYF